MSLKKMYSSRPNFDLTIQHAHWGVMSSKLKSPDSHDHCETQFVQTIVSLNDPETQPLLDQLVPVREFIDREDLGFENLMQRDLDDSRVSNQLIPYLLENDGQSFRMFPSILVLLLPMHNKRVSDFYLPRQETKIEKYDDLEEVSEMYGDGDRRFAFKFSRLRNAGGSFFHYGAKLEIKSQFCRLVIVDGQHRAMALLALLRQLTSWPDSGKAYRHFYANYPRQLVEKLSETNISLPVTICFFPQLHAGNKQAIANDLRVIKGARKLFLDVNRNAKQPSKAREVLLDDARITSEFVRAIMTKIKERNPLESTKNVGVVKYLSLSNLFYDQSEDYRASIPKVTITSVLHLQYMLLTLLLGKKASKSNQQLLSRVDFGDYSPAQQANNRTMRAILDWEGKFDHSVTQWKDSTVPLNFRKEVVGYFMEDWGRLILHFLDRFPGFQSIARATNEFKQMLAKRDVDVDDVVNQMLFEGQGVRTVHDKIFEATKTVDEQDCRYPYPQETKNVFAKQQDRLSKVEEKLLRKAASIFWGYDHVKLPEDPKHSDYPVVYRRLTSLFSSISDNIFKTKAFQVAVVVSIGHIERALNAAERKQFWALNLPHLYLDILGQYFRTTGWPSSKANSKTLEKFASDQISKSRILTFIRNKSPDEQQGVYNFVRNTLRGDLKDGKWTYLKYPILEIFNSEFSDIKDLRTEWASDDEDRPKLLEKCGQIITAALKEYRQKLSRKNYENRINQYVVDNKGDYPTEAKKLEFARLTISSLKSSVRFTTGYEPALMTPKQLVGAPEPATDLDSDSDDESLLEDN